MNTEASAPTPVPQCGDLLFVWGTYPTDWVIRRLTGGPSHVRLCLGDNRVAEMIPSGFHYGTLDKTLAANGKPVSGGYTELVPMHLDAAQQAACQAYAHSHAHERYSWLACVSQFLNRLGSPLMLDLVGQQDCSQFAAAADGLVDWATMTPALLYKAVTIPA